MGDTPGEPKEDIPAGSMVPEPVTIAISAFGFANTLLRLGNDIFVRYKESKEFPKNWVSAKSALVDVKNMLSYITEMLQSEGANLSDVVRNDMVRRLKSVELKLNLESELRSLLDKLRKDFEDHTRKRQSLHNFFRKNDVKDCICKVSTAAKTASDLCQFLRAELNIISCVARMQSGAPSSSFKAQLIVGPELPLEAVLDFDDTAAHAPNSLPAEATLKSRLLSLARRGDIENVTSSLAVYGRSGVGKSVTLTGLTRDSEVRNHFQDGVYFFTIGKDASERDLIKELADIVSITGGRVEVDTVKESQTMEVAAAHVAVWFRNKKALFVIDNLRASAGAPEGFVNSLRGLVQAGRSSRSCLVLSTRDRDVAHRACEEPILLQPQETDSDRAKKILLRYANGAATRPNIPPLAETGHRNELQELLRLCAGLPLTLAEIGRTLSEERKRSKDWDSALEKLKKSLERADDLLQKVREEYPNNLEQALRAISAASDECDRITGFPTPPESSALRRPVYVGVERPDSRVVKEAIPRYAEIRRSLNVKGLIREHRSILRLSLYLLLAAPAQEGANELAGLPTERSPSPAIPVVAVDGHGGYGKTTCLQLLANDDDVRDAFSNVICIVLGQNVRDVEVVEKLKYVADEVCCELGLEAVPGRDIQALPKGSPKVVSDAVDILRWCLPKARTLLILDDVWPREVSRRSYAREWTSQLAKLLSDSAGGAVLVATRMEAVANEPDITNRFTFGRVEDEEAAIEIVKKHAGDRATSGENAADFISFARELCLPICDGWHLPLGLCGNLLKMNVGHWEDLRPELERMIRKSDVLDRLMWTTLQSAQQNLKSRLAPGRVLFREDVNRRNKQFKSMYLPNLYKRLAILSSRRMPTFALGLLFGIDDEVGKAAADVLGDFGLVSTIADKNSVVLHDLQHAFAVNLCKRSATELSSYLFGSAMPVSMAHCVFVKSIVERFCDCTKGHASAIPQWHKLCENEETRAGEDNLATYACENIVYHLVETAKASEEWSLPLTRLRSVAWFRKCHDFARLRLYNAQPFGGFVQVLRLLCSYPWIRERGNAFGRAGVLRDVVTAATEIRHDDKDAAQRGAAHALNAILNVLQLVSHERFRQDAGAWQGDSSSVARGSTGDVDSSAEAFTERGMPDSGLAGELYGRLAMIKFKRVDEVARPYALQVAAMLQKSIQESARPPWLCPRNECYLSSESSEDERCVSAFFATHTRSGGIVHGVDYMRIGGESLLLSGGGDGSLWVHNAGDPGGAARELTEHGGRVMSVVAAGRGAGGAAGNVHAASCSWDGTVRLWGCEHGAAKGEMRRLHTLETSNRDSLACVDLTPDAARVVAGEHDKNCVHVWTRRSAGAAAAARGADAYVAIALSGHTAPVSAVRVSRTGERVVSASKDGTVRVWRVAMDAGDGPSHKLVSWADGDSHRFRFPVALELPADAQTVYVADSWRSDIAVVHCESAREVAPLRSDSVDSVVWSLALLKSSGGGASGWLFAGHDNGVISEWDLAPGARTCSAVYGDPRSRAGRVRCMTARFLDQGSNGGDAVARSESTRARPRVTRAAAGTGGGRDGDGALCGAGQSRVDFAAGYEGGAVRVWRASVGCGSGENSAAEAGAGVDERAVERHADTVDDWPVSLAASADGRWLVSGSDKGVLCVWDTGSAACVATLREHEGWINGIDVSGDGTVFASCSDDGTARVWTLQSNGEWAEKANLDHRDRDGTPTRVYCVVMTADALHAITGDDNGHVRVWNASTGMLCGCGRDKHWMTIKSLAVLQRGAARSGADLVFASRDRGRTCVLWSLSSGRDLNCEEDISGVPDETDLGNVFTSCAELAPLPAWWHEQRGFFSRANHFVFSGGGRGGTRRYEVLGFFTPMLRVVEMENDSRASVGLDSAIRWFTCFQRQEGGDKRLVVCCGLRNGIVAMLDLVSCTS